MNIPVLSGRTLSPADYRVVLNQTFLSDDEEDETGIGGTIHVVAERTMYGARVTDPLGGTLYLTGSEILAIAYMCGLHIDRGMVARRYPKCIDQLDAIRLAGRPT